ncbi:MAG: DUF1592 domain-containing protein [Gemmatimonadota bacterium]
MKLFTAPSAAFGFLLVALGTSAAAPAAAPAAPLGTSLRPTEGLAEDTVVHTAAPRRTDRHLAPALDPDDVIQGTCVRCHSERRLSGNLSLESFRLDAAADAAATAEKMIRKLRAGMMPPPGTRRPGADTLQALVESLEQAMDEAASQHPNPGHRTFQRLNRPEYERAILELLGIRVDAADWLPLDQMSANFDNIADVQTLSPTLLESYLNAAAEIARRAVGDRSATATTVVYKNSEYVSQHPWDWVEGAPYGTRGGLVTEHVFPADGEYSFEITFSSGDNARFEDVDISVDGERVALITYSQDVTAADGRGAPPMRTEPVFVRTGQHRVSAAFVRRSDGPYEDLIRPHDWSLAGGGSGGPGITTLPHIKSVGVAGPYNATGVSDSPSRQRIFSCRPSADLPERACAGQIIDRLASAAFRRPASPDDVDGLLSFYDRGAAEGGFETGVRSALEAILSSPLFVLRLEREPDHVRPGTDYRLSDWDLASRLSFFLWGAPPDEELATAAAAGRLSDPDELARQAARMLDDPRSAALGTRFAAQWLRLQDLSKVHPDPNFYPNFDENLADLMREETVTFFNHLVQGDRGLLELFTADYTWVNERLARHYGFSGVAGNEFQRVRYPNDIRRGLLGQGSVLVLTSLANRTSPVLRGKWVMEVLLGSPPPPPPPNVPTLEETEGAQDGRMLTTRERMELHRANPTCNSCHSMMDPIGLALDNFDVTGKERARENGMPLDTRGDFYDGTPVSTPGELADALLARPLPLARTFTENLMAYALGRRVEYYDQPTVREIVRRAEAEGYPIKSLILGVVNSEAFRMKRAGPVAADAATDGTTNHPLR